MWIKLSLTKQRENTTLSSTNPGFTIVELLVVIVVIGILAALVIVSYTGITQKAAAAVLQSDLKNASTKLELVKAETGTYSADDSSLPKSNGTDYQYTVSPDGSSYSLSATDGSSTAYHTSSVTGGVIESGVAAGHTLPGSEVAAGWKQIVTGDSQTCAISSVDKAYCWGFNNSGRLGNNSTSSSSVPVAVDVTGVLSGKTVLSIASGLAHSCAIASDNKAYCWGGNSMGALGNNSTAYSLVPVVVDMTGVLIGKTILSIVGGNGHNCAVASDNLAYCWGRNDRGQLGNNSTTQSLVPVAVNTSGVLNGKTIKSINAGSNHTCVVASDDLAYCWGLNSDVGLLGNNSGSLYSSVPVAVNTGGLLSGKTIKSISAGEVFTCVIASDNLVYCWGYNGDNEFGNGLTANSSVPVAVSTAGVLNGKTVTSISTGGYHTCVIASDNKAYCWSWNDSGQLGNNSTTNVSVPVAVDTSGVLNGKSISSISAGDGSHTCAIASDNQAYCWGKNGNYDGMMDITTIYGQLGNNSAVLQSLIPVTVSTP